MENVQSYKHIYCLVVDCGYEPTGTGDMNEGISWSFCPSGEWCTNTLKETVAVFLQFTLQ
jgi:hypothetical protein